MMPSWLGQIMNEKRRPNEFEWPHRNGKNEPHIHKDDRQLKQLLAEISCLKRNIDRIRNERPYEGRDRDIQKMRNQIEDKRRRINERPVETSRRKKGT